MYNEHFGLKRAPFRITPDTKLFYPGGSRGEVLDALIYAISSGEGIIKVVGEVGSGKTMLCRMLEERLADSVDIVYLANPSLSPEDTLHAIALEMKLDVAPDANRLQVMHALQERLLEKHANNRQVVVFIEEAQSMPLATLEEIRLLSNLETHRDKLLQIVLFGQPELDKNLEKAEIRQLKERITHSFYLQPFTPEQMREYVNFRMRAVGYRGPDIFRGAAYRRLAKASAGLTRRINILADKALLAAFAEDTFDVGNRHVRIAINDSQFVGRRRWGLAETFLVSGALLIVAALVWTLLQRPDGVAEQLRRWLPGGAVEHGAGAVAGRGEAATGNGAAHAAPAQAGASPGEPAAKTTEVAAGATAALSNDASPAPLAAADDDGPGAPPASAPVAAPAARHDGSRLVLSESLSVPPKSDSGARAEPQAVVAGPVAAAREDAVAGGATPLPDTAGEPVPPAGEAEDERVAAGRVEEAAAPVDKSPSAAEGRADVGPLTEARLAATRAWLASADGRHFSIQLLLTDFARRANLERFLREREAAGEVDDYYVFETRIRSNLWYGVLYKEYETFSAAKAALEELPEALRDHRPFIRNVRDIAPLG
ncbi:MAG: AAA family ATPase [Gammaproteobacteria bacterium]|nr:AAA family ATPase [Gammaproteobacteria bacterium]NIM74813.1 AAA family ATPase [Gammaproteobacteria bacterium]NIN39244.1 AAA family ATPase [Gammaproteobacteria bacterium]NIO26730.1 AAA family ATPase [Gammaproteobacteria bacterium]NIO67286.1 AAA family ATPase [Gammaproteobacteria bacterium]